MTHKTLGKSLDEIIQQETTSEHPHVDMELVKQMINDYIYNGFDKPYYDKSCSRYLNLLNYLEYLKQDVDTNAIWSVDYMNAVLWMTAYPSLVLEVYQKLFAERDVNYESRSECIPKK